MADPTNPGQALLQDFLRRKLNFSYGLRAIRVSSPQGETITVPIDHNLVDLDGFLALVQARGRDNSFHLLVEKGSHTFQSTKNSKRSLLLGVAALIRLGHDGYVSDNLLNWDFAKRLVGSARCPYGVKIGSGAGQHDMMCVNPFHYEAFTTEDARRECFRIWSDDVRFLVRSLPGARVDPQDLALLDNPASMEAAVVRFAVSQFINPDELPEVKIARRDRSRRNSGGGVNIGSTARRSSATPREKDDVMRDRARREEPGQRPVARDTSAAQMTQELLRAHFMSYVKREGSAPSDGRNSADWADQRRPLAMLEPHGARPASAGIDNREHALVWAAQALIDLQGHARPAEPPKIDLVSATMRSDDPAVKWRRIEP
eukprot:m.241744 g.241744  ORF g.241744 m.241744 type:complete len:373 (+) comp13912_c0_seq1:166-1284(+)